MGRNMSQLGQLEEERVQCMSISIEELDTLDNYESHEELEAKIINYLENHPDIDVQRCGEALKKIDRKQDRHITFLKLSERKQMIGYGGNLEILKEEENRETAASNSPKDPRRPYRKNTVQLF